MAMMTISSLTAQELKQFTLEDLNFGGKNYRKMVPENRMYEWKGEMPVRLEKRNRSIEPLKHMRTGYRNVRSLA